MINQIIAILAHEWKGFFRYGESRRTGWVRWTALAILTLTVTRMTGAGFGSNWTTIPAVAFLALIFIPAVVADSFAGERERKTLETILASPISDQALLTGKYLANLLYGTMAAVGMLCIGLIITLLDHGWLPGALIDPAIIGASIITAILVTGLTTAIGILVSLHAPTVRRAIESLSIILLALTLIPVALTEIPLPGWIWGLAEEWIPLPTNAPGTREFLVLTGGLLTTNILLITIIRRRFRREELLER